MNFGFRAYPPCLDCYVSGECSMNCSAAISKTPIRLRLRRVAGFNLQALSLALNGRQAVNCARPCIHGNPFHHDAAGARLTPALAAHDFRAQLLRHGYFINEHGKTITMVDIKARLFGKNLACFCRVESLHCHVDTLLEIANQGDF